MRADLHIHTYYSDGLLSPAEIAETARKNGVQLIAVTDHDTMIGCRAGEFYCKNIGVKFVHGAEISAYEGDVKVHTLCYSPDENNTDFKAFMAELYENSLKRTEIIINKLNAEGVKLSFEEVSLERHDKNTPVHAMHISRAGFKKGYCKSAGDFFMTYLMYGKPAFCCDFRPTPEKTVEIISAAGGVASLAHPGRIDLGASDLKNLAARMKSCGLCGIEAVYSAHTVGETAYYKELARELNLEVTGGSDIHAEEGKRILGMPAFEPEAALLHKLKIC